MASIDIDFEVYKALTNRRASESITYNDVLRDLLGLGSPKKNIFEKPLRLAGDFVTKGVIFPEGTKFRAGYKGQYHTAAVDKGTMLMSNGRRYTSLSAAAVSITGSAVNGWRFWECQLPGNPSWISAASHRKNPR